MYIKCWGSRGSIPVSGREYLKYGGDTTCLEIRTRDDAVIIVDAGTGIRRLGNRLLEEGRRYFHFIFTHAHWDHIMGFPYFKPLYSDKAEFRMHRCPFHSNFVETILSKMMEPPNFPVKYGDIKADIRYEQACPRQFHIGTVTVTPIALSHPNNGSGYKFTENGKSFVFLTDNELGFVHPGGLTYEAYREFSSGADLLIHDGEYTPEEYRTYIEWGHSVYTDTLRLAREAKVERLGLFHINQDRTDVEMDEIVKACRRQLQRSGSGIECFAVAGDMEFQL